MNLQSFVSNPRAALITLGFAVLTLLNGCATTGEPPSPTGLSPAPSSTTTTTTYTTSYTYNADGALTRVTTQVDQNTPTKTYVTWDNFTPNPNNPAQGTVAAGNGNVRGYGPTPGQPFTTQYGFDQRNRLTHYTQDNTAVAYTYHPSSTLASSTLPSGDALRFYYGTGALPPITNIHQSSTGLSSGRMGPLRYLSNNKQQVLLQPRKDVSGVYDAGTKTLTPYSYDPYGGVPTETSPATPEADAPAASYDLTQNPFRFAAEYQDPTWQGLYLRARWYSPGLQMFLSRDPRKNLNRFGYTDGNPITRVDPTGENWIAHDIMKPLETGPLWRELIIDFSTGPVLGILGIFAEPSSWWNKWYHPFALGTMLGVGWTAEGVMMTWAMDIGAESVWPAMGTRASVDLAFGTTQSAVGSANWKNGTFNVRSFAGGMAMTFGSIVEGRLVAGIGYRPFNMTAEEVRLMLRKEKLTDDQMMVWRIKRPLGPYQPDFASPLGDKISLGLYHEAVFIATRDEDLTFGKIEQVRETENVGFKKDSSEPRGAPTRTSNKTVWDRLTSHERRYQYVGKFALKPSAWGTGYLNLPTAAQGGWYTVTRGMPFINNCHWYANAVVRNLGPRLDN